MRTNAWGTWKHRVNGPSVVCIALALLPAVWPADTAPGPAVAAQAQARTIPYVRGVNIAERLRPDDHVVQIVQVTMPPGIALPPEPLSWEASVERLSKAHAIVVARRAKAAAALTTDGSWIRTAVAAEVTQTVGPGPQSLSTSPGMVEFSFDGGELLISGVRVRAGRYPVIDDETDYILFLDFQSATREYTLAVAMAVDIQGALVRVAYSDGTLMDLPSLVYGQPAEKLIRELVRR